MIGSVSILPARADCLAVPGWQAPGPLPTAVCAYVPGPRRCWPHPAGETYVADDLAAERLVEVLRPYNPGDRVEIHAIHQVDHGIGAVAWAWALIDF